MSVFDPIFRAIVGIWGSIDEIRNDMDQSKIHGPVCDVDAKNQLCRIVVDIDDDGEEVKSPWIRYGQTAGTRKFHSPPSVGQMLSMFSPNGDHSQAVAFPFSFSEKNPSPSDDPNADVEVRGKTRKTQKDANLKYEVDGVTHSWSKQNQSIIIHKDKNKKVGEEEEKVDDAHPWKGNKEKPLHSVSVNKDNGYSLVINVDDDKNEHKITFHPEKGLTISFGKEKHSLTMNEDSIKTSFDGGKHVIEILSEGIKHISSSKVSIDAPQIEHLGDMMIKGSLHAGGVIESIQGVAAPILGGSPGNPGSANKW